MTAENGLGRLFRILPDSYVRIERGQASALLDTLILILILIAEAIGVPLAHLVRD
ncbi:hypothetical protein [Streptomyces sp. Isolate_45]|uniref:hypothetical protein n=1 Tax=Streptomyces sp. Isolate_45 TaxID=2950111 RepID=UPI002481ABC2|nr:hypothetical protein [Streptomyces sp. Isolate_45]MDA5283190.1 hypothetical protein [Streptomyces sp. Isolate_45]